MAEMTLDEAVAIAKRLEATCYVGLTYIGDPETAEALRVLLSERARHEVQLSDAHCLLHDCFAAVDPETWPALSDRLSGALEACSLPNCLHVASLTERVTDLEAELVAANAIIAEQERRDGLIEQAERELEEARDEIDELREREVNVGRALDALGKKRVELPQLARDMRARVEQAEAQLAKLREALEKAELDFALLDSGNVEPGMRFAVIEGARGDIRTALASASTTTETPTEFVWVCPFCRDEISGTFDDPDGNPCEGRFWSVCRHHVERDCSVFPTSAPAEPQPTQDDGGEPTQGEGSR